MKKKKKCCTSSPWQTQGNLGFLHHPPPKQERPSSLAVPGHPHLEGQEPPPPFVLGKEALPSAGRCVSAPPCFHTQHSPRWESGPGQNLSPSSCTAPEAFPRSLQGHFQLCSSDSLLLTPNPYAAIWTSSAGFKHTY